MTSVLPDDEGRSMKLKQTMEARQPKEEARSFLTFSRENLSISNSELEQGFNKYRFRPSRNTILCMASLAIAILCLGLETWELRCSLVNSREIEELKRDVDTLRHRLFEPHLGDVLKAFEDQLYETDTNDESDNGEVDIDNADYDYGDDSSSSHDHSVDYHTPLTYGSRPSDFPEGSLSEPVPTSSEPGASKAVDEILAALNRFEAKHKNVERERLLVDEKKKDDEKEKIEEKVNSTMRRRRDILSDSARLRNVLYKLKAKRSVRGEEEDGGMGSVLTNEPLAETKVKRSVPEDDDVEGVQDAVRGRALNRANQRNVRNQTRRVGGPRMRAREEIESSEETEKGEKCPPVHPPKKYRDRTNPCPPVNAVEVTERSRDKPARQTVRATRRSTEGIENGRDQRYGWRDVPDTAAEDDAESHKLVQDPDRADGRSRRVTRRNLQASPQVCAVHYGADSTLFTTDDEHTGNGRARHSDGVFKAWRPSSWVSDLGMGHFFSLASDGKLTVHQNGLYLVYAQIHYLDEHDENGFHVLVNGRPILQCMLYSPGMGHKSRSCFSAQATFLRVGDKLTLKDIGSARYTLFQHDKSFFGLVKVGDVRQQQRRLSASRQ